LRYWIFTVFEDELETIINKGKFAVEDYCPAVKLIEPGDGLIFYVKRKGAKRFGGKIAGVFKVLSPWRREEELLMPNEIADNELKYPMRVDVKPIKLGSADFETLAWNLSFIVEKEAPYIYLVDKPGNMRKPIPETDAIYIMNSLEEEAAERP